MSADGDSSTARIHDQGYRPFDGQLGSVHWRFVPIAIHGLRLAWKGKWFKRLLWASFFPLGIFSVLVIVRSRMGGFIQTEEIWMQFWGIQLFFSMLAVYHLGRNSVGEDLRSGALVIYFSRPVDFRQYLLGKWLSIALGVSMVTLGPALVLNLFMLLADPQTGTLLFLRWLAGLVVLTLLYCSTVGLVMLAISALTGRGRAAGIVWVLVFFLSSALAGGLAEATDLPQFQMLGFPAASAKLAESLIGSHEFGLHTLWQLLGHLVWSVLGALIVLIRLGRWRNQ